MNTIVSDLNIIKALKNSLTFFVHFIVQYWVISVIYFLSYVALHMLTISASQQLLSMVKTTDLTEIIKQSTLATFSFPCIGMIILASIAGYFMHYFCTRGAYSQLESSDTLTSKPMLKTMWQLFCLNVAIILVQIPLFILLFIPGIWWSIKMSVANVNVLCTDDGPIASIKKSFAYTDNHFWQCFGYWCGTTILLIIASSIVGGILGIGVAISSISGTIASHGLATALDWKIITVRSLLQSVITLVQVVIIFFCQAWLYIYLKKQAELLTN